MIRFADIFSGCGGLTNGFYRKKCFRGILAIDSWRIAGEVFTENHSKIPFELRDMHNLSELELITEKLKDKCDILLGGPPCQGFSTLGKRRDGDRRSSLVEIFLEICLRVKPKIIVMENVRGITSKIHENGVLFPEFINQKLANGSGISKYDIENIIIDTREFGLAQTRVRWFLIAVKKDINHNNAVLQNIIKGINKRKTRKVRVLREAIGDLPYIESGEGADKFITDNGGGRKIIYNHKAMKHSQALVERFSYVPIGGGLLDVPRRLLTDHLKRMLDGAYGNGGHPKNIYGRLDWDKPAGTIVAGIDKITCGRFVHPSANRLLTPRECARIQSFPDTFRFLGSLVNQYYMIGNAVPPKISSVIADSICQALKHAPTSAQKTNRES